MDYLISAYGGAVGAKIYNKRGFDMDVLNPNGQILSGGIGALSLFLIRRFSPIEGRWTTVGTSILVGSLAPMMITNALFGGLVSKISGIFGK